MKSRRDFLAKEEQLVLEEFFQAHDIDFSVWELNEDRRELCMDGIKLSLQNGHVVAFKVS